MTNPIDKDNVARMIMLVRGLMENGGFYWAYVAVKPTLHKQFAAAIANKYNIQNFSKDGYGEVVVSGEGKNPPDEVTKKVAEMFSMNPAQLFSDEDPEATLANKLEELQKAEG